MKRNCFLLLFIVVGGAAFSVVADEVRIEDLSATPPKFSSHEVEFYFSAYMRSILTDLRLEEVRRMRGPDLVILYTLEYTNHGVDAVIPEHFFQGDIVSQGVVISHRPSGFHFSVENFTSIAGGSFSDLGDRAVLSLGLRRGFGRFYGAVQHRWVHTNYRMREDFFYADWHRTSLQCGARFGPFSPYVFASSDIEAHMPADEMAIYGGVGSDVIFSISPLRTTINLGASVAGSLFWYNQSPRSLYRSLYRLYAGLTVSVGRMSLGSRVDWFKDVFNSDDLLMYSFRLVF